MISESKPISSEKLYHVWASMKDRCNNPKNKNYKHYGGRGIKVYYKWNGSHDYINFKSWALSNGYKEGLTLDRIDVNGNYEPDNCRWITQKEQTRNIRRNINITYNGETHILQDWAYILDINPNTLYHRIILHNWDIERAFQTNSNSEQRYNNGLNKANEINKKSHEERKELVKEQAKLWAIENKNLIINCKTGIKRTLEPLSEFLNIKDMRTISTLCCDSLKVTDLLNWLKEQIGEVME